MKASLIIGLLSVSALAQETPPIAPGADEAAKPKPVQVAEAPVAVEQRSAPEPVPVQEPHYQRYDHRGALGLLLATTAERKDTGGAGALTDSGWRSGLELGGTYPVSFSGNEFKVAYRALLGGPVVDSALYLGFRGYFDLSFWKSGLDQWKTFFDLDLCAHVTPAWSIPHVDGLANPLSAPQVLSSGVTVTGGPRVAVGVQLDFLPVSGAYFAIGGQLGFGTGVRFGAEALFGFQLRSYLLE